MTDVKNHANLIWSIADLLRDDYKQADYGKVILPLVVIRRLDQSLESTKDAVLARSAQLRSQGIENVEPALVRDSGQQFYNDSPMTLTQLLGDAPKLAINLPIYLQGFSSLAREAIEKFEFDRQIDKLDAAGLLYQVVARICSVDLHPDRVANLEMGYLFEELIRKFAEQSNETAGHHFTPREVVKLMVNLLVVGDEDALSDPGVIRTVFDCACGTGGMLSEAELHIKALNPSAQVDVFGQEVNPESFAICLADMLVKGQNASHIKFGNSLSDDHHAGERFHYGIANPPFGVDWAKVESTVRAEHADRGYDGRFGPGLPRKSDGQLLFLMHLVSKMRDPAKGGSRIAIVHNGSPLFTGAAGSGESEIRRYLLENDLLEAIVAMPEQLFYNTGIASYVWLLSNRKSAERKGKVQLIDARQQFVKMRKSLGDKRREFSPEQIDQITRLHGAFEGGELVKIVDNTSFGYRSITVEQPLRGYWQVGADTWDGVEDDPALAKLDDATRTALCAGLRTMDDCHHPTELDVITAMAEATAPTPAKSPRLFGLSAANMRRLAGRALVRDPAAPPVLDAKGRPLADSGRRDTENVPLAEDVEAYLDREVRPHVPGAWCPDPIGKVGYEIPFSRLFYTYAPPRPSAEIKAELKELEGKIHRLLAEVVG
jgi:type I restriction enzyme M protein